ncbi:MAG: glycosyltransferase family 2 protein [Thermoplasmata archaeon]
MMDSFGSPRASPDGIDLAPFWEAHAVVVLPTLNEEEGLARTLGDLALDRLDESGQNIRVVIIDGGSTDGTLEVARSWGVPVLQQIGRGKGGAMLEAVTWVHRLGIPYVVTLDADATYPSDRILPALDLLQRGTDLVIGVRRRVWGPPNDFKDLIHRVGNVGLSYAASFLTRRSILDLCSGFWGVSTERFMELKLADSHFAIEAELVLKAIRRGYIVHQIPVDYRMRVGQAKLRALRDGSQIFRTILQCARPTRRGPLETASKSPLLSPDSPSLRTPWIGNPAPFDQEPSGDFIEDRIFRYLGPNLLETRLRGQEYASVGLTIGPVQNENLPAGPQSPRAREPPEMGRAPVMGAEVPPESTSSLWSRSGAWLASARPNRTRFPSLLVLTSRLNFLPERQLQTLMAANGLLVADSPGPPSVLPGPAPPLASLSATR